MEAQTDRHTHTVTHRRIDVVRVNRLDERVQRRRWQLRRRRQPVTLRDHRIVLQMKGRFWQPQFCFLTEICDEQDCDVRSEIGDRGQNDVITLPSDNGNR